MNISHQPIYLRIISSQIPDLTLVDLPGMTMVACTDKGQPKDIKDQINNLISKNISDPNTLILAVIPARPDIETDIGLELVKKHDPEGKRTIGILTKIDLMNNNTDITNYLHNNNKYISKDLILNYGYFAVNCQTCNNKTENDYFYNHSIYSKFKDQNRIGTKNLTKVLDLRVVVGRDRVAVVVDEHRAIRAQLPQADRSRSATTFLRAAKRSSP